MAFGSTGEERPDLAAMPLMAKWGRILRMHREDLRHQAGEGNGHQAHG